MYPVGSSVCLGAVIHPVGTRVSGAQPYYVGTSICQGPSYISDRYWVCWGPSRISSRYQHVNGVHVLCDCHCM
jgi:hypothetical protein